mgnify:CR=1 FL=1|jgi:hypothetical protein
MIEALKIDQTTDGVIGFLSQFSEADQSLASDLLNEVDLIAADELTAGLTSLIRHRAQQAAGLVGLYAEKEVRQQTHGGKRRPDRLYPEKYRSRKWRAYGNDVVPVPAGHARKRDIGSEGLVASLISSLCRAEPTQFHNHPGPDRIREQPNPVRVHLLVTDFIGSGQRAFLNLEAAWRVRSVKSWHSRKHLKFEVVAFSGTESGIQTVEKHPSQPVVSVVQGCPTLFMVDYEKRRKLIDLCQRYGPPSGIDGYTRLGFGNSGCLLAFDHGAPNNMPRLFHALGPSWEPLFVGRSTARLRNGKLVETQYQKLRSRLERLREKSLATSARLSGVPENQQAMVAVLAALKRTPRHPTAVSARIGLSVAECERIMERARADGFLGKGDRPTQSAYAEFAYLRTRKRPEPNILKTNESPYFPSQLRPPV